MAVSGIEHPSAQDRPMLLGCIADALTRATDLGVTLARTSVGDPGERRAGGRPRPQSRTIPASDAVEQSLAALDWLRARGASRI
jgi:uncharacterized protein YgbK (DUF1537 family)